MITLWKADEQYFANFKLWVFFVIRKGIDVSTSAILFSHHSDQNIFKHNVELLRLLLHVHYTTYESQISMLTVLRSRLSMSITRYQCFKWKKINASTPFIRLLSITKRQREIEQERVLWAHVKSRCARG